MHPMKEALKRKMGSLKDDSDPEKSGSDLAPSLSKHGEIDDEGGGDDKDSPVVDEAMPGHVDQMNDLIDDAHSQSGAVHDQVLEHLAGDAQHLGRPGNSLRERVADEARAKLAKAQALKGKGNG